MLVGIVVQGASHGTGRVRVEQIGHHDRLIREKIRFCCVNSAKGCKLSRRIGSGAEPMRRLSRFHGAVHDETLMTKVPRGKQRQSTEAWRISTSGKELDDTRARIADQARRVASLIPGSADHRVATEVLLLLEDSLYVLASAADTLAAARGLQQAMSDNRAEQQR